MEYRELTKDQIEEEYPFYNLPEKWIGLDIKDNGCINVTNLTRTLHELTINTKRAVMKQYAEVKKIAPVPNQSKGWCIEGLIGDDEGRNR